MDEPDVSKVPAERFAAIILAAGRGERAGGAEGPKQYRMLGGRTVLRRTLDVFASHPAAGQIVVAIHADDVDKAAAAVQGTTPLPQLVIGGATRQASTLNALRALGSTTGQRVLIHDAARPFVDHALIDRVLAAIDSDQGAVPVLPVSDTLKRANSSSVITATVERAGLHAAQTPQGFPLDRVLDAHEKAARE
jgi:2-C-methyl-D-erythritol 4-phosphate cytidylyltransferase / 2-C-methyl-D-erythritol 2,4-cyclodiphosphate synthase